MKWMKWSLRFSIVTLPLILVLGLCFPSADAQTARSTITFENRSGEPALVKLVGPTAQTIEVPQGESRTINAAAGEYYILVRYGDNPGQYTYTRGEPFTVQESTIQYSVLTITLHKVIGGNYGTRPSSAEEFDKAPGAQRKTDKLEGGEPASRVKSGSASTQRKYSLMSAEEARSLVDMLIKNRELPSPPSGYGYWKLPEIGLHTRGIKINDNDYIVFSSAEPEGGVVLHLRSEGNILEFFMADFHVVDQPILKPGIEKVRKALTTGVKKYVPFSPSVGILFSTVDFQVVDRPILKVFGDFWSRETQVIEKGGYNWFLGTLGILLSKGLASERLILFEEPILDGSRFSPPSSHKFGLSISQGGDTVLVEVEGRVIQLK